MSANNQGTTSYQVSTDNGTTWNYWNGTAWTTTTVTDGTQTSTAADINTNIATLDTDGGDFLWRAYLTSDGAQKVELNQVDVTYQTTLDIDTIDKQAIFFANPVSITLELESHSPMVSVSIYALGGQKVLDVSPNTSKASIDLASLTKGVYLMAIDTKTQRKTAKLVKE